MELPETNKIEIIALISYINDVIRPTLSEQERLICRLTERVRTLENGRPVENSISEFKFNLNLSDSDENEEDTEFPRTKKIKTLK